GAGRARGGAVRRPRVQRGHDPRAVRDARAHAGHRGPALRQGVAPGRGAAPDPPRGSGSTVGAAPRGAAGGPPGPHRGRASPGVPMAGAWGGRRDVVARHMQRVHGDGLGPVALRRAVQRAFDSYARYWVEVFRLPAMTRAQLAAALVADGLDNLTNALAAGKGA